MAKAFFAVVLGSIALATSGFISQPKVIYGQDNRVEPFQVEDAAVREVSDSTVALVSTLKLSQDGRGGVSISTSGYGASNGLCKDEPFYDQPTAAHCSGFLVAPDMIATAGHCMRDQGQCDRTALVFGFRMQDSVTATTSVPENNVYRCKSLVAQELTRNQDYALIKLDRPVVGFRPLQMANAPVQMNDAIIVIGHPAGLPTKVAGGAAVRRLENGYFVANLDTYGGNSGSAVFNARTMMVEGILVRGERDFRFDSTGQCTRSNICTDLDCRGEDVTFISYITKALAEQH